MQDARAFECCITCLLFFWRAHGSLTDILARYQEERLKLQPASATCVCGGCPFRVKTKNRSSSLPRRMCNVRPEYDFLWLVLPFIDGPRFVWDFWENHTLMNILPETFNCGCSVLRSALPFLRLVYSKASTC